MTESAETVRSRDGAEVAVRPVEPADRDALRRGFERLGADSRYRRFLSPVEELTASQLDYLTDVDHHDHEALVALDDDGVIVGVARYIRAEPDSARAEVAVAVVDDWQARGLGTALLGRLSDRARAEGVETFTAAVLAENRRVIDLLGALGSATTVGGGSGQLALEVELADREGLRALMHHAASGAMRFLARIALRRSPRT